MFRTKVRHFVQANLSLRPTYNNGTHPCLPLWCHVLNSVSMVSKLLQCPKIWLYEAARFKQINEIMRWMGRSLLRISKRKMMVAITLYPLSVCVFLFLRELFQMYGISHMSILTRVIFCKCPRIIVSHAYPYQWESNCKGTELGYRIHSPDCYRGKKKMFS